MRYLAIAISYVFTVAMILGGIAIIVFAGPPYETCTTQSPATWSVFPFIAAGMVGGFTTVALHDETHRYR